MRKSIAVATLVAAGAAAPAFGASSIDTLNALAQDQFKLLTEDLGGALSYKPLIPSTTLGITGFDIGIEATATKLNNPQVLDLASSGSGMSTIVVPKLAAHKGLPFGFDVGAFYSSVPTTNIKLVGAEVRYALIDGGIVKPTVSLRGSYTKLTGVDQLDFDTKGLDLSIAKGITFFTPYIGVGKVWVTATPKGVPTLSEQKVSLNKVYGGVNFNFGLMNFAVEGDRTGSTTTYGAKVGLRW